MSVVVPIVPVLVPPLEVNTTTSPPVVSLFPAASFATSVRVAEFPDSTLALEVVMTDVARETGPTVTAMVGCGVVTGLPPIVAPMVVAVPASTPVNAAV